MLFVALFPKIGLIEILTCFYVVSSCTAKLTATHENTETY